MVGLVRPNKTFRYWSTRGLSRLGLFFKLTPEQQALWPAIEAAMQQFAKLRFALIYGTTDVPWHTPAIDVLRERATKMAATADALAKLVDTESALY
jgi:hypothetical protein